MDNKTTFNKKTLTIDGTDLYIFNNFDKQSNQKTKICSELEEEKIQLVLNKYGNTFSIEEFKNIFTEKVQLIQPEKFVQLYLFNNLYTNPNWKIEYSFEGIENEKNNRCDLINISEANNVLAIIECKHFEYYENNTKKTTKNFISKEDEAKNQCLNYINSLKLNKGKERIGNEIIYAAYCYDGNYFFNNFHELNYIEDYINNFECEFFKTSNYYYSNENNTHHTIKETGKIDFLKYEMFQKENKKNKSTNEVNIFPNELNELSTFSNPRDLDILEMIKITSNILNDIKNNITKNSFNYNAVSYTTQKQISVKEHIFNDNSSKTLFGIGLSLDNGQHSVAAYNIIYSYCLNQNNLELQNPKYSQIIKNIQEIEKEFPKLKEWIVENVILNAKITVSATKKQTFEIKQANNYTTKATMYTDEILKERTILIQLNKKLIKNKKLPQIILPKVEKIDNLRYIDPDFLFGITALIKGNSKSLNIFSMYRKNDFSKEISKFKEITHKAEKDTIITLKNSLEKINKELSSIMVIIESLLSNNSIENVLEEQYQKRNQFEKEKIDIENQINIKENFNIETDEKGLNDIYLFLNENEDLFNINLENKKTQEYSPMEKRHILLSLLFRNGIKIKDENIHKYKKQIEIVVNSFVLKEYKTLLNFNFNSVFNGTLGKQLADHLINKIIENSGILNNENTLIQHINDFIDEQQIILNNK